MPSPSNFLTRYWRGKKADPEVAHILDGERKLFNLRVEARKGEKSQLRERADQLREEVNGLAE